MYTLSQQQIDYILNDIKMRGIETEDLQLNLLDHICCVIECELQAGDDFEEFYQNTITKFFKKDLREIEEETILLLTFKHYYAMKKTMSITGLIAAFLIVAGSIFRIQHWPGANIMFVLGIALLCLLFLPLMFTLKLNESKEKRDKAILVIGSISAITIVLATAFKLMHWTGGNVLFGIALFILLLVFTPAYLLTGIRNPENKINTITNAVLIVSGGGLLLAVAFSG